jgi:hypothetical protein
MKTLLLAATMLTAAVATPALAQTRSNNQWYGPNAYGQDYSAYGYVNGQRRAINRQTGNVYDTRGHYVGSDPDPTVRDQLARDPSQGD